MSVILGSPVPAKFGVAAAPGGAFPDTPGTYTSQGGAVVVPGGALDRWWAWRATGGATRREVVVFGDSTTFGSGGLYSWLQRLRDRAVSYGLPDGGKGIFAGSEDQIVYDSPEVNGFVSLTFSGSPDSFDNLTGNYYYDAGTVGHVLNLQFRGTAARLWYRTGGTFGQFTYSVDGGSVVTVNAVSGTTDDRFVYLSGLTAGVTHTLQIVNTSGAMCRVALAPLNSAGLAIQKHAVSGSTFQNFFYGGITPSAPYTQAHNAFRYQTALGLVGTTVDGAGNYRGAAVDTAYASGERVKPVLAATHLGFNDLTNTVSGDTQSWNEYVKRFAGACYDASCDGIVISGQLPYNANWPTYGAARFQALKDEAAAQGLAFVDIFYPIGGASLAYAGGTSNPHLTRTQYQAQADFLWDSLLGL